VVVNYLDVLRPVIHPVEADTPAVVDADAVLAFCDPPLDSLASEPLGGDFSDFRRGLTQCIGRATHAEFDHLVDSLPVISPSTATPIMRVSGAGWLILVSVPPGRPGFMVRARTALHEGGWAA
jgi:hypothetical protein